MMAFSAWKQSYSRFPEQLDVFQFENSMKFVLLKFNLLFFLSMVSVSHLPYILVLDFILWGYLNVPTAQQPQNVWELGAAIRLDV